MVVINHLENYDGYSWMEKFSQTETPYVTITHNGGSELWPTDMYVKPLLSGMAGARKNYFPSANSRDWMEIQLGTAIPKAVFFKSSHQVSYSSDCVWPDEESVLRLAMVGRLDPKAKGHDLAFSVLASDDWRNRALELNIYGEGPTSKGLKRLAKHWNLTNVHFHGEVTDIEGIWKTNHFLLQPSRFEGLPCTLMEAMLCGRGAIVTDVGGNAELVEDGVSGFVAAYPATKCLALAMEKCWLRRMEAREIGRAARQRAEKCLPEEPEAVFGQELLELCVDGPSVPDKLSKHSLLR
jgi:glycosyltransferase involved in cell wall biosynthesis